MRDLKFWMDKFETVARKIRELSYTVRSKEEQYNTWVKPFKLKKQFGHALNRDYWGHKIPSRRNKWLTRSTVLMSKAGAARQEVKRLEKTKLAFYTKKITELGGTVPERW